MPRGTSIFQSKRQIMILKTVVATPGGSRGEQLLCSGGAGVTLHGSAQSSGLDPAQGSHERGVGRAPAGGGVQPEAGAAGRAGTSATGSGQLEACPAPPGGAAPGPHTRLPPARAQGAPLGGPHAPADGRCRERCSHPSSARCPTGEAAGRRSRVSAAVTARPGHTAHANAALSLGRERFQGLRSGRLCVS